jgi:DNA invertase Pin-like site-specific DNA recombinase
MVAEMERKFIRERQQAGMKVAKVKAMRDEGHGSSTIVQALGISRMSVHRERTTPNTTRA